VPVEFDHHELSCFISADALTIFLHEVTVRCESFEAVRQLNDCSFVIAARNGSIMHGADCECLLKCIPGIFFELLVSKLAFSVFSGDTHDYHIDVRTNRRLFTWVGETLAPAMVADVDHASDAGSKLNKHAVVGDVLHETGVAPS